MKYPIGIQSFDQIIEDGYLYIDKTDLVYNLTHEGKIYFLSRPRRFGKSLLVSTLKNYFLGRKELFKGLKIDAMEKDWKVYPVFHIDFNGGEYTCPGSLRDAITGYISDWEKEYCIEDGVMDINLGLRFKRILAKAHEKTGRRAVVLVDEYDKPVLDVLDVNKDLEEEHRNILKGFYSVFKGADEHLQFVLLTGVTKFSQVSVFSGFNQPKDISMHRAYETLCGITQKELEEDLKEPVMQMAEEHHCTYEKMLDKLKENYDGYHFSTGMTDIYNPYSLLNAFDKLEIRNYWFVSGTPEYLIRLLSHSEENLEDLVNAEYPPEAFADYKATAEMPLPMIYQSGYLTIKGYDRETELFRLDFPNEEVRRGFLAMLASGYISRSDARMVSWAANVRNALNKGKIDGLREHLESLLSDIPYSIRCSRADGESEPFSPKNPALSPGVEMASAAREACGAGTPTSHGGK